MAERDERTTAEVRRVAHEGQRIRVRLAEFVQQIIKHECVPHLVLGHRGKGDVFLEDRTDARPFGVAMPHDDRIVGEAIQQIDDCGPELWRKGVRVVDGHGRSFLIYPIRGE